MTKVEKIINEINEAGIDEVHIMDFHLCFNLMREMESAMVEFIKRVEVGEIRSKRTYSKFKKILTLK